MQIEKYLRGIPVKYWYSFNEKEVSFELYFVQGHINLKSYCSLTIINTNVIVRGY